MKNKEKQSSVSRRDWFKAAAAAAAVGAGLMVVRPTRAVAAPISMRPAEHWEPTEDKK